MPVSLETGSSRHPPTPKRQSFSCYGSPQKGTLLSCWHDAIKCEALSALLKNPGWISILGSSSAHYLTGLEG